MNKYVETGLKVLELLEKHGHEAYFIGGTSRDIILNRDVNDIDITTSALPQEVVLALSEYQISNKDGLYYGTVKYFINDIEIEITSFRKEGGYVRSRRPISVEFIKEKEIDSIRRDFTVNALYMDVRGKVYDFHNGLNDLNNMIIDTIGDPNVRFKEDALRMLRAIRFSITLNMKLSQRVIDSIKKNSYLLCDLKETVINREIYRIKKLKTNDELVKILNDLNIETEGLI